MMTFFLVFIIGVGLYVYLNVYLPKEAKLKAEREKEAEDRRREAEVEKERLRILTENTEKLNEINSYFKKFILKDTIIIDSNIWMNYDYKNFFLTLKEQIKSSNSEILVLGPVFDEICNKYRKNDFGTDENYRAGLAKKRIEEFQMTDFLTIKALTVNSDKKAYADPVIIKMIIELIKEGKSVALITDDRELRIRMRGMAKDNKSNCVVIHGKDLIEKSDSYCRIKDIHYEVPDYETYYSESEEGAQPQDDDQTQYEGREPQVLKENVIYLGS